MRLYLYAQSKDNIGYTPDWLQVRFDQYELTLDIQASIDYSLKTLDCRCKGELIPWTLLNLETGDEVDLWELPKEKVEEMFPEKRIAEIVCDSKDYRVGVYPVDDDIFEEAMFDILSSGKGLFEMYIDENHYYTKEFKFDTEVNF